jgi:hypothetical protein
LLAERAVETRAIDPLKKRKSVDNFPPKNWELNGNAYFDTSVVTNLNVLD